MKCAFSPSVVHLKTSSSRFKKLILFYFLHSHLHLYHCVDDTHLTYPPSLPLFRFISLCILLSTLNLTMASLRRVSDPTNASEAPKEHLHATQNDNDLPDHHPTPTNRDVISDGFESSSSSSLTHDHDHDQSFEQPASPTPPPRGPETNETLAPVSIETKPHPPPTDTTAIRSLLTPTENAQCPDDMIARYWRATDGDVKHAVKRLKDTLAWWAEETPHHMHCPACRVHACSHYMHVVCRDRRHRPVIYSCMELATNKCIEDNRRHMISAFEAAISLMDPGAGVESWCWILDFHGFTLRDCDPRLARIFLHLAATHYPERLGSFFIVDAPALFNTLWAAIERFIDPNTRKKIAFLQLSTPGSRKRDKLRGVMAESFDEETLQWLIAEMEENRVKRGSGGGKGVKFYDYSALKNLKAFSSSSQDRHCNLGSPGYLKELREWKGPIPSQLVMNSSTGTCSTEKES